MCGKHLGAEDLNPLSGVSLKEPAIQVEAGFLQPSFHQRLLSCRVQASVCECVCARVSAGEKHGTHHTHQNPHPGSASL